MINLAYFYWNPNDQIFTIPYINHPVRWYGLFFVIGFFIAYYLTIPFIRDKIERQVKQESLKKTATLLADRFLWFSVIGTVIGARLGEVFFYDWNFYRSHPLQIFKIWHGGLASHGGGIGVFLAAYFFYWQNKKEYPSLPYLSLLDCIALSAPIVCGFIRLGNFINQEILGTPSTLPWAVLFGTPADRSEYIPRHPVQLYESMAYFSLFFLMYWLWKNKLSDKYPGLMIGLFLIFSGAARFFFEFFKMTQESTLVNADFLQMGQYLSLPYILLGFILVFYSRCKFREDNLF